MSVDFDVDNRKTALVVDDDKDIRELLALVLETEGTYREILTAEHPVQAMSIIDERASLKKPFHELWTDNLMPYHDGFWLIEQAAKHPFVENMGKIKVIMMTASVCITADSIDRFNKDNKLDVYYLSKPFALEQVSELSAL